MGIPPVVNNLPFLRNNNFVGRDYIFEGINNILNNSKCVALYGMYGVGKTQIAIEYAYRESKKYDSVIWINSESISSIIKSFNDIFYTYKLNELLSDIETETDAKTRISNWLSKKRNSLLIFDNAILIEDIYDFIASNFSGKIIITSRNPNWSSIATELEIFVMKRDESKLVISKNNEKVNLDELEKLCDILGDLPLAMEQARAYLSETGLNISEYINRIKKHNTIIMSKGNLIFYEETVASTLDLILEKIEILLPGIKNILEYISFLGSEDIPVDILKNNIDFFSEEVKRILLDDMKYDEMLTIFRRYSVLTVKNTDTFTIHRLVQRLIRDSIDVQRATVILEHSTILLNKFYNFNGKSFELLGPHTRFLTHGMNLIEHSLEYDCINEDLISLMKTVGEHHFYLSLFNDAKVYFLKSHEMFNKINCAEFELEFEILYYTGYNFFRIGEFNKSKYFLEEAISIAEKENNHSSLINAYCIHASLSGQTDDFDAAELFLKKAKELLESLNDVNSPLFIQTSNGYAELMKSKGKYNEAITFYHEAILLMDEYFDKNNRNIAIIYINIADCYLQAKKSFTEAKKYLESSIEILGSYSLEYDPEIARAKNTLGLIMLEEGNITFSRELFEEALEEDEKQLDRVHYKIASRLNNIGLTYSKEENYEKAMKYYLEALEINESLYGRFHHQVAIQLCNIAFLYTSQNNLKKSCEYLTEALKIEETIFGRVSLKILDTKIDLVVNYVLLGNFKLAKLHLNQSFAIAKLDKVNGGKQLVLIQGLKKKFNL
ncbi:DUF2225 domain-containing protein [Lysinibacillus fusiformis]|uniref:DUF2225 domain-containing protein n=1 Tax=Lysinibacillus fusiformis TaxID=28031 RepID=UPI0037194767